jgi:hypothetical protein
MPVGLLLIGIPCPFSKSIVNILYRPHTKTAGHHHCRTIFRKDISLENRPMAAAYIAANFVKWVPQEGFHRKLAA